jgi:hypothetical protein
MAPLGTVPGNSKAPNHCTGKEAKQNSKAVRMKSVKFLMFMVSFYSERTGRACAITMGIVKKLRRLHN